MNTITIDTDIYKGAEVYARKHNLNLKKFIERVILNAVSQKPAFRMKPESELSPVVRDLIGIAKHTDTEDDLDGKDARMEYLSEKYGL